MSVIHSLQSKTLYGAGRLDLPGDVLATDAKYLLLSGMEDPADVIKKTTEFSKQGLQVLVTVEIDYSKKTAFTKGVVQTIFKRPLWS